MDSTNRWRFLKWNHYELLLYWRKSQLCEGCVIEGASIPSWCAGGAIRHITAAEVGQHLFGPMSGEEITVQRIFWWMMANRTKKTIQQCFEWAGKEIYHCPFLMFSLKMIERRGDIGLERISPLKAAHCLTTYRTGKKQGRVARGPLLNMLK